MNRTASNLTPSRLVAPALALTTCSLLLLQTAYTRIFSYTMWYHYAFMLVSLAMFGLAFGAVCVFLAPAWFADRVLYRRLSGTALAYALSIPLTLFLQLQLPVTTERVGREIAVALATFLIVTVPFAIVGVVISVVLTRFARQVGRLYAFDLAGSAGGCLLLWVLIGPLAGPGVVLFAGALAAAASLLFARAGAEERAARRALAGLAALLTLMVVDARFNVFFVKRVKGENVAREALLARTWSIHSVVTVTELHGAKPFGWGFPESFREAPWNPADTPRQLGMTIDGTALTVLTGFDGDVRKIDYLARDVPYLAYHLRPQQEVLVVGVGGGRDVIAGLVFHAGHITGVELDRTILDLLGRDFAGLVGHLDRRPDVTLVHDEARSWVERSPRRFDLIQISLIDTWAASASGAFALTENHLYTTEALECFLRHLTDQGLLSITRWWHARPGEVLRTITTARASLARLGADSPAAHFLIARPRGDGLPATVLISRRPLAPEVVERFEWICGLFDFEVVYTPAHPNDPIVAGLLSPDRYARTLADYPLKLEPATDDNPYFFNMLRFSDLFRPEIAHDRSFDENVKALYVLTALMAAVVALSLLGLLLPLGLRMRRPAAAADRPAPALAAYFGAIGLGFMLIEITQIQRLTIFLGHPAYSLLVVLFALLLATGIGSSLCGRLVLRAPDWRRRAVVALAVLLAVNAVGALAAPGWLAGLRGAPQAAKIACSLVLILALGLPLGAGFPIGLWTAAASAPSLAPWFWAVNGAMSVVGSVLAVMLSVAYGVTAACSVGVLLYAGALLSLLAAWGARPRPQGSVG